MDISVVFRNGLSQEHFDNEVWERFLTTFEFKPSAKRRKELTIKQQIMWQRAVRKIEAELMV